MSDGGLLPRLHARLADGEVRNWLRGLAIALVAGLFLAFSGAFGTDAAPLGPRFTYWLTLMTLGYVWGAFVARFFFRGELRETSLWIRAPVAALVMSVPFSLVVWYASHAAFGSPLSLATLPIQFAAVLMISLVMTALNILVELRAAPEATGAARETEPAPVRFLERLPPRLRGADVWAVEAEDHYLRIHTSRGQDLILLRLADAVAELEGVEGAQVHRSWWVSRDAIAEARRGDGRATLTLKDGAQVPVSRTYARELRERGWI